MKRLIAIAVFLCASAAAQASYVVSPEVAREYLDLRARAEQQPDNAEMQFEYAIVLSYVGKIEDSSAALKRVRALSPEFAREALPRYAQKSAAAPDDNRTKYRLGFLYYFNEDYDQALKVLSDVAERQPIDQLGVWALGYMAMIKGKQRQWDDAEGLVERALSHEPHAYGLHAARALVLKKQGHYFAAVRAYYRATSEKQDFEAYEKQHLPIPGISSVD